MKLGSRFWLATISIVMLCSCSKENESTSNYELKGIEEVKVNCNSELEEAKKGKYSNLEFENIIVPTEFGNELYNIKITEEDVNYEQFISEIKNLYETCKETLGEDVVEENIRLSFLPKDRSENYDVASYSDIVYKDAIQKLENKELEEVDLLYLTYYPGSLEGVNFDIESESDDEIEMLEDFKLETVNNEYFQSNLTNSLTWIRKDVYKGNDKYSSEPMEYIVGEIDNIEKVYYKYTSDKESLNTEYNLLGGKLSIADAIKFAEAELNNKEYLYTVDDKVEVERVYVIKISEDTYEYFCTFRRNLEGVLTDQGLSGYTVTEGSIAEKLDFDGAGITITGPQQWDFLLNECGGNIVENRGVAIKEILPLDTAIKIVSEGIGEESTYIVNTLELSYLMLSNDSKDLNDKLSSNGTLVWKFVATNKNDNKETKFYVDAVTGAVNQVTLD